MFKGYGIKLKDALEYGLFNLFEFVSILVQDVAGVIRFRNYREGQV